MINILKTIFSWFSLVILLIGFIVGLLAGWFIFSPKTLQTKEITSRTVLDKIAPRGFLITRSVLMDQVSTVKVDQGSSWSNFWWGYEVNARGMMKSDIGVDLAKVKTQDIIIDENNKTICVKYPAPEVSSISLEGQIEVQTKTGILKRILDSSASQDYNLALTQLKEDTKNAIKGRPELLTEARDAADQSLSFLLEGTDYKIAGNCR
jgi:hypothetical protein